MNYKADLHIHSVLSPCGALDMSPSRIVHEAKRKGVDIIAITDHNSTLHCELAVELGRREGLLVLRGVEVTTKEEVHCLAYFETANQTSLFQEFIDVHLPHIKNKSAYFGEQLVVDQNEVILYSEPRLLLSALSVGIDDVQKMVHSLGGLFIPAHIDRERFGIIRQLGFFPTDLPVDAYEVSAKCNGFELKLNFPVLQQFCMLHSSDAHQLADVGASYSTLKMSELTFQQVQLALKTTHC